MLLALLAVLFALPVAAWAAQYSGFLDNYPQMQPHPDRPGASRYFKPGVDFGEYDKIAIEEITIFLHADSEEKGIKPDRLKALSDEFRRVLIDALEPDYPVVTKVGKGVLILRMAITNVRLSKKKRSILNFTPGGFALYTLQDASGATIILDDATIEAELVDSQSGVQIGVLIDQQSKSSGSKKTSWNSLKETLDFYAEGFRARMDEAREK
jgi:hypothetical protein